MEKIGDDISEFFEVLSEKIVNFFSELLSGKKHSNDEEADTEEACKDAVAETEAQADTECVCTARVLCTNATEDSEPLHMKKEDSLIHISGISRLNKTDIEIDGWFRGCKKADACTVDKESIEGGTWQEVDSENDEGEGKEILNRDKSYMICTKHEGVIYFYDDGQEVLTYQDEILLQHRITFSQELYDSNKFYRSTADYINEIEDTDAVSEDSLAEIREVYNSNKERYEAISMQSGYIPPELIAAIHYRENTADYLSGDFSVYLHNGDPLGVVSEKEPKPDLFGIEQFDEAALDALEGKENYMINRAKQLNLTTDSKDLTAMVTFSVLYNGWNQEGKSSYAYSGTNLISQGLYISDGNYKADAVDKNYGTYLVLKTLLNQ